MFRVALLVVLLGWAWPTIASEAFLLPGRCLHQQEPTYIVAVLKMAKHEPTLLPTAKQYLQHPNASVRLAAAEAVVVQQPDADIVPLYAKLLLSRDNDVRAAAAWRLGRIGARAEAAVPTLAACLRDEALEVRVQAGQALANLGPHAAAALPALIRAVSDSKLDEDHQFSRGAIRSPALLSLLAQPKEAVPLLLRELVAIEQDDPFGLGSRTIGTKQERIGAVLVEFGPSVAPSLVPLLRSSEKLSSEAAAFTLAKLAERHPLPDDVCAALEQALKHGDKDTRYLAACALARAKLTCQPAVAVLQAHNDKKQLQEHLAHYTRMSPHNPAALAALFKMLNHPDLGRDAYEQLAELDLPAEEVVPTWTKALTHDDAKMRQRAAYALARLGAKANAALPTLLECWKNETEAECRQALLAARVAIAPQDRTLLPLLAQLVANSNLAERVQLIKHLIACKAPVVDVQRLLMAFLRELPDDERQFVSHYIDTSVELLCKSSPDPKTKATLLLELLATPSIRRQVGPKNSWFMRNILEEELRRTLPASADQLRTALRSPSPAVRQSVALVLARADRDWPLTLPILFGELWQPVMPARFLVFNRPTNHRDENERERMQERVARMLLHRHTTNPTAIAAAACDAWRQCAPKHRRDLEVGLRLLHPEATPHLVRLLDVAEVRFAIACLLATFPDAPAAIVPILHDGIRSADVQTLLDCCAAAQRLGPRAASMVTEVQALLRHKEPTVRARAMLTLGKIGPTAKEAVPHLETMLHDAIMQPFAAMALAGIDPTRPALQRVLRTAWLANDHRWREDLHWPLTASTRGHYVNAPRPFECVQQFGAAEVPFLADLVACATADHWAKSNLSAQCGSPVRLKAALRLAELGPAAKAAVPALTKVLADHDPFIRDAAASALGRIGTAADKATPTLIALLEQEERATATGAWTPSTGASSGDGMLLYNLGRVPTDDFVYGYDRHNPLDDMRPKHPHDTLHVLSLIDRERTSLPLLQHIANDVKHPRRLAAALAVQRMNGTSPDLLPAFVTRFTKHMASNDWSLAPELRQALAVLGPQLKPHVEMLTDYLREKNPGERDHCAVLTALGQTGMRVAYVQEVLKDDKDWRVRSRCAAAGAWFRITGDAKTAIPILRKALTQPDEQGWWRRINPDEEPAVLAVQALVILADAGNREAQAILKNCAIADANPHVQRFAQEWMRK